MNPSRVGFLRSVVISAVAASAPIGVTSFLRRPFDGVDWSRALAGAGTVRYSTCGALHGSTYYTPGRGPDAWPGGYPVLTAAAVGYERSSGRWLAAIPLHCGGTSGVTLLSVFADAGAEPEYVGSIRQGPKSSVFFKGGAMHVATAKYSEGESMCAWRLTRVVRYEFSSGTPVDADESIVRTAYFRAAFGEFLTSHRLQAAA